MAVSCDFNSNIDSALSWMRTNGAINKDLSIKDMTKFNTLNDRLFEKHLKLDAEFLQVPEAYRVITKDIDATLPFGKEAFINEIEKLVPGSKESVMNFFRLADDISAAFKYIGRSQGKPDQKVLIRDH